MFKPDFGKYFFEKHQTKLVALANTWLGRRFFGFWHSFRIPKDFRVMALYPNAVSGDWKFVKGRLVKRTVFSTDNHYQMKLERAWGILASLVPSTVAWKMLTPQGALSLLPLVAMTVFNPDATPTTSCDGFAYQLADNATWANTQGGAGNGSQTSTTGSEECALLLAGTNNNTWLALRRGIFLFDTSSIPDTDVISAAVFSLKGTAKSDTLSASPTIDVYTSNPASNTAIANGDFTSLGTTSQTGSPMAYASWSTSAYNDFTFNATGIANITKTGVSKFGTRNANYDVANTPPTWAGGNVQFGFACNYAAVTGGATKPKLDVTYTTVVNSAMLAFF